MSEPLPRAVLDSNVIFSRVLHELLGRAAASLRLLDLIWSDELLAETERVLIDHKPLTPAQAARWVGYLRDSFPEGRVDLVSAELDLSVLSDDPHDEHVCALAIAGQATYLFTFDRGYLRDALAAHGVQVVSPSYPSRGSARRVQGDGFPSMPCVGSLRVRGGRSRGSPSVVPLRLICAAAAGVSASAGVVDADDRSGEHDRT